MASLQQLSTLLKFWALIDAQQFLCLLAKTDIFLYCGTETLSVEYYWQTVYFLLSQLTSQSVMYLYCCYMTYHLRKT